MRGAAEIVAARMAGVRFARVHVHLCAEKFRPVFRQAANAYPADFVVAANDSAEGFVWVEPGDSLMRLDLRCVHGLIAYASTDKARAAEGFTLACRARDFSPAAVLGQTEDGTAFVWAGEQFEEFAA